MYRGTKCLFKLNQNLLSIEYFIIYGSLKNVSAHFTNKMHSTNTEMTTVKGKSEESGDLFEL